MGWSFDDLIWILFYEFEFYKRDIQPNTTVEFGQKCYFKAPFEKTFNPLDSFGSNLTVEFSRFQIIFSRTQNSILLSGDAFYRLPISLANFYTQSNLTWKIRAKQIRFMDLKNTNCEKRKLVFSFKRIKEITFFSACISVLNYLLFLSHFLFMVPQFFSSRYLYFFYFSEIRNRVARVGR